MVNNFVMADISALSIDAGDALPTRLLLYPKIGDGCTKALSAFMSAPKFLSVNKRIILFAPDVLIDF